jgi:cytochrome c
MSYDEINQARKPGFFGYPYFLGDNEVFPDYDFATKKEGPGKDPKKPVNDSPHNTGVRELPSAQPAFIWYGKGPSKKYPLVGKGGASAMTGPVYYSDLYPDAPYKLPEHYNGKLFIFEWIRKWIMAVTMDANGNYVSMEPFLPQLKVVAPIDMQIAPDCAIYLLAYGTNMPRVTATRSRRFRPARPSALRLW